jgi:hypothetical protein
LKWFVHPLNSPPSFQKQQKAPALALPPDKSQPGNDPRRAAEQEVFVREVDDALRQDEMVVFLKRYGLPLLVLVVAGLLALGGYLWWNHSRKQAIEDNSEQIVMALDEVEAAKLGDADKRLAPLAEDGGSASSAVARLMRAGIALRQDRKADAVKLFGEVAADKDAPQPYRDLALVRQVAANFDAMDPQQVVDRLKPLAVPGNPWFGNAGELVGIAYLKQGKTDLAGPLFAQIAREEKAPETLRRRARQLAGLLGVDAIDDAKAVAGAEPPAPAVEPVAQ